MIYKCLLDQIYILLNNAKNFFIEIILMEFINLYNLIRSKTFLYF